MSADFQIENHGSILLVRPLTRNGKDWLNDTAPADAQFLGNAMAVEPRYWSSVESAMADEGLTYDE